MPSCGSQPASCVQAELELTRSHAAEQQTKMAAVAHAQKQLGERVFMLDAAIEPVGHRACPSPLT
jgi:hypothetical protein